MLRRRLSGGSLVLKTTLKPSMMSSRFCKATTLLIAQVVWTPPTWNVTKESLAVPFTVEGHLHRVPIPCRLWSAQCWSQLLGGHNSSQHHNFRECSFFWTLAFTGVILLTMIQWALQDCLQRCNWYCTFVTARCIMMQSGTSVSVCVTLPVLWSSSSFTDSTNEAVKYVNQTVLMFLTFQGRSYPTSRSPSPSLDACTLLQVAKFPCFVAPWHYFLMLSVQARPRKWLFSTVLILTKKETLRANQDTSWGTQWGWIVCTIQQFTSLLARSIKSALAGTESQGSSGSHHLAVLGHWEGCRWLSCKCKKYQQDW